MSTDTDDNKRGWILLWTLEQVRQGAVADSAARHALEAADTLEKGAKTQSGTTIAGLGQDVWKHEPLRGYWDSGFKIKT